MANKLLETNAWKAAAKKDEAKLKPLSRDIGEVQTHLDTFSSLQDPLFEGQRIALEKAEKALDKIAKALAKDKALKALPFTKHVTAVQGAIKTEIVRIKKDEKAYEKTAAAHGAKEVDVYFRGEDFLGNVLRNYRVIVKISSEPDDTFISKGLEQGSAKYRGIMVSPQGNVYVTAVSTSGPKLAPEGNASYKVSGKVLDITAVQQSKQVKVKASSMQEMMKKIGVEGETGVDFKVFKVGGKVVTEREAKEAQGTEVEWEVLLPTQKFTVAAK